MGTARESLPSPSGRVRSTIPQINLAFSSMIIFIINFLSKIELIPSNASLKQTSPSSYQFLFSFVSLCESFKLLLHVHTVAATATTAITVKQYINLKLKGMIPRAEKRFDQENKMGGGETTDVDEDHVEPEKRRGWKRRFTPVCWGSLTLKTYTKLRPKGSESAIDRNTSFGTDLDAKLQQVIFRPVCSERENMNLTRLGSRTSIDAPTTQSYEGGDCFSSSTDNPTSLVTL
ncbi:hypothetical protein M431DRAFT_542253 [Trichoderma harzianum CBS 226.95]|uniref:Uncharacterized protein n=1 Tax=Trichoderma harzianum CBS 226.95 TaxID=983964 RepID=A0A2T3ZYA5_TRIHA|nr:hypothetical protein M431DRAFT_542253 [Trichoderma harzianum CBS 226.95]PTB49792.1 hypothetical protein M431DRAFT_542253 [Trichoderma harzianum CBS 226.95]